MDSLSEGFVLGYLFSAVQWVAIVITVVRWAGGDAGADPESLPDLESACEQDNGNL